MKILKILCISISLAFLVSGSVFGATIKVPDDYATIQQAIDVAVGGDTVLVAPNTYNEGIDFLGKKITVRSEAGPDLTIINTTFFIRFTTGETEETLLEGFKIIGGIDIFNGSSPQIKNCNLIGVGTHGTGGHGSIGSGSSPTFIDCQIYGGRAGIGGGYDIRGNSSATFINCEFSKNEAGSNGGAIYINNSSASLENCTFLQNSAGEEGGAIFVTGSSILSISFCNFSENNAQVGGGIFNGWDDNVVVVNSNFEKNNAQKWGGAIFTNASPSFTIENCIFTENNANWHGGAIHVNWSSSPTITNSIFDENIAGSGGGAIWIQPDSFSNITNCTFFRNSAGWKGGAILNSGSYPTITNCILWKDSAPVRPEIGKYINSDPDPTVKYCDINQDGFAGSNGNIRQDPLFVDPENGDVHLQYGSPCIDTGTSEGAPNYDIDRDVRPQGSGCDMGADEYLQFIEIKLDIKPGSYPNSINLKSKGKVPVAVLTTDDFDAYDVDPDTCVFANANPLRWQMEDVDYDSDDDMLFHFKTRELDLTKESTEATLEGETFGGIQIIGTDSVKIVPEGKGYGKKSK